MSVKTNNANACVMYVDGGCRPGYSPDNNERFGGWGIHGYEYTYGDMPKKPNTKKDTPTVEGYKEGAKVPPEKQVTPLGYIDAYGSMTDKDRNDIAEIKGFEQALNIIKEKGYNKVHLLFDSQYVIDGVTGGYERWSADNWMRQNGPRPNKDIWEHVMSLYYPLKSHVDFSVSWVNGHSGDLGNDRADYLATKGVYLGRNGVLGETKVTYSDTKKYREPQVILNRLFPKSRWYFNTVDENPQMSKDGRFCYHLGAHGSDDTLVGKQMSDSVACVIYTKEIQHVLEAVRQKHRQVVENEYGHLCLARLDRLLLPSIYSEIERDGTNVLSLAPRKLRYKGLCTIDEQELTKVIEPSGLTFNLTQVHNFMEAELNQYLEGKATITDITSSIYETTIKKKKEITSMYLTPATKVLKLPVKVKYENHEYEYPVQYTIGIDIPSRELMKAIQGRCPKVYAITWSISESVFRYGVIFDLGDDCMLWMGKDSSMQLVYPRKDK